jgi:hypothetical protein
VGSSSQINILKSRGRLTLLQTPYVLELPGGAYVGGRCSFIIKCMGI